MFNEKILQQIDNHEVELPANDWEILSQKINHKRRRAFPMWWYAAAAAGVALLVGFGFVFFDFGTQMTPITQINADNNIENKQEYETAKYTKDIQGMQNNLVKNKQLEKPKEKSTSSAFYEALAGADLQSVPTTAPITNRGEQPEQQTTNNIQQTISIEEAEKLMKENQLAQNSIQNPLEKPKGKSKIQNNYFASLSASSSPTAFGETEATPRRMFIPSLKGDNAIMRNIGTETKYNLPLTFAFTFGVPLAKRLHLNTGLQYTYIHSKTEKFENDTRKLISRNDQELHYLGVPLMLSYRIVDKKIFKFYVAGGGVAEKGLLETHNTRNFNELNTENTTIPTNDKNRKIEGFQFSLNANFGASVTLAKGLALYAEPGFAWYIPATKYPQPISRRTKNPFFVSITAGLRFNFEK